MSDYINKTVLDIIILTHGGRIVCFLYEIIKDIMDQYKKEIRFMNTAIILLKIDSQLFNISLSLIYSGKKKNPQRDYFINNKEKNGILFKDVIFNDQQKKHFLNKIDIKYMKHNTIYNIYLIRHAEAIHNTQNTFDKFLNIFNKDSIDTPLTSNGINQINNITNYIKKVDYYFCSPLKRTIETIYHINKNMKHKLDKVIVLPCTHEISGNAKCKTICQAIPRNTDNFVILSRENVVSCDKYKCNKLYGLTIEWKYYNDDNTCTYNMINHLFRIIYLEEEKLYFINKNKYILLKNYLSVDI